jgi:DNA modification methylase
VSTTLLLHGDACHLPLADQSVHCVVTSPPYYGLRAYGGVEASLWPGGAYAPVPGSPAITVGGWRGTLGNEPEVARYIWHTLLWLRDVRRLLRDDGVVWIVIGDSYATNPGNGRGGETVNGGLPHRSGGDKTQAGYSQGSLLGIPQQVLLAAIADGWVVRNDCVWAKANPMPESVSAWRWQQTQCRCMSHTRGREPYRNGSNPANPQSDHDLAHPKDFAHAQPDPACPTCGGTGRLDTEVLRKGSWRHTRATETVLMLTKGMQYFANSEAVREAGEFRDYGPDQIRRMRNRGGRTDAFTSTDGGYGLGATGTRNPRNVMMPAPSPLGLAHYAAFPPGLIEPLIRATCPERSCPTCGMGWSPALSSGEPIPRPDNPNAVLPSPGESGHTNGTGKSTLPMQRETTVHGLRPSCPHYCPCGPLAPSPGLLVQDRTCPRCAKLLLSYWTPGIVCDPFVGSGTTLAVARALSRHAIGVDRSWPYLSTIARQRLGLTDLAVWEGAPAPPPPTTYSDLPLFRTAPAVDNR